MDGLKKYESLLTARFGAVDNVKLFLGSQKNLSKIDVDAQFMLAANALEDGSCNPSADFSEPGLNRESIAELFNR
jgi:hypothetical protein